MSIREEFDKLIATRKVRSLLKTIKSGTISAELLVQIAQFINPENTSTKENYGATLLEIKSTTDTYKFQMYPPNIFIDITIASGKTYRMNLVGNLDYESITYHSLAKAGDADYFINDIKFVLADEVREVAVSRGLNV